MSLDVDVLIIGAGMSGIGLAVQMKRQYPFADFEMIEKSDNLGGTWWLNTYPGCGCDVASHFYSYSFELNPDWTHKFALQEEIAEYFLTVAKKHNIVRHISFLSTVQNAEFDEPTGTWVTTVLDQQTGHTRKRRSKVLVTAVGTLSVPKDCDIPGATRYKGKIFHSARWDHTFDWTDKEVVVIGNGCSATQFVPILSGDMDGTRGNNGKRRGRAKKVVQFSRQPHWLAERPNPTYSPSFKWMMRNLPLAMRLYRWYQYYLMESEFAAFDIDKGEKIRAAQVQERIEYMKRTAPTKYHEALIPKTEIGCKRKVLDTDYFSCLHNENMELVYADPIQEIIEDGVRTGSGREVKADAIILATGFQTQRFLYPIEIRGEKGLSLSEHWAKGGPRAYYGTCVSSFPNLFIMSGPNTGTGHNSVIYTSECQMNFILRVLRPILQPQPGWLPRLTSFPFVIFKPNYPHYPIHQADIVSVTAKAEERDNDWIRSKLSGLIWASGCTSWYIDNQGRNTMLYPDYQFKYWLRGIFIPLSRDFFYRTSDVKLGKHRKMV